MNSTNKPSSIAKKLTDREVDKRKKKDTKTDRQTDKNQKQQIMHQTYNKIKQTERNINKERHRESRTDRSPQIAAAQSMDLKNGEKHINKWVYKVQIKNTQPTTTTH